ncbi:hypothetical protein CUMW_267770 [Citrus unshiu]|uniref:Uncharacterized protein n=1 Tax=Citrus unshiu TaxID=55188 RepID=A0A2H5QWA4_CITUN|nr:hypothetical protein CUMW_267770 [Citrus unshiu]
MKLEPSKWHLQSSSESQSEITEAAVEKKRTPPVKQVVPNRYQRKDAQLILPVPHIIGCGSWARSQMRSLCHYLTSSFWYRKEPLSITAISAQIELCASCHVDGWLNSLTVPSLDPLLWNLPLSGPSTLKTCSYHPSLANSGAGQCWFGWGWDSLGRLLWWKRAMWWASKSCCKFLYLDFNRLELGQR